VEDAQSIANDLVEEISNTVHRRYQPRRAVLMPPCLKGRRPCPSMKIGEQVLDRVDELLDQAVTDWPDAIHPDIYIDLICEGQTWQLEWVVDTTGEVGMDDDPDMDVEAGGGRE